MKVKSSLLIIILFIICGTINAQMIITESGKMPSNIIYDRETGEEISRGYNAGETGKLGETKNNSFEVVTTVDASNRSDSSIARTFSHELGHTAGLEHPWLASNPVGDIKQGEKGVSNKTVRNNLMNSDQNPTNPSNSGTQLTTGQLKSVDELINKQQN